MMGEKDKSLDELISDDADERAKLPGYKDTNWARLSPTDFAQERAGVFREMRRVGRQRRISSEVKQADAEAEEAAKRRGKTVKLVDVRSD